MAKHSQLKGEIREALKGAGLSKITDNVLSKCMALATSLDLSPTQMAECWEAYSLNKNTAVLDEHSLAAYRTQLIKLSDVDMHDSAGAVLPQKRREMHQDSSSNNLPTPPSTNNLVTPAPKRQQQQIRSSLDGRVSLSPDPPLSVQSKTNSFNDNAHGVLIPSFAERSNAGTVVVTYNPNKLAAIPNTTDTLRSQPKCLIRYQDYGTNVQQPYRHMFTVLEDRARQLDQQWHDMYEAMVEVHQLGGRANDIDDDGTNDTENGVATLEAVGVPRQDTICCIGRICNMAHEGRINATSILLEGSRTMSGGARVEVDLTYIKTQSKQSYSLFPGQMVAMEGLNCSGRKMIAQRICEGAALPMMESTVADLMNYHHDNNYQDGKPLQIIAAAGPFTCSDNLDYEPFLDLMNIIHQQKPDVVVLTGPFVDLRHPTLASGQATLAYEANENDTIQEEQVSYEVFFANKIAAILEEMYDNNDNIQTQFVLVPNLDDATAEWVYPQAPFKDRNPTGGTILDVPGGTDLEIGTLGLNRIEWVGRDKGGPQRVHCVSNPCTFRINELVIGVTSTDVLFHMSVDETSGNLEPGSRLGRIAQHMLQQRSYYPLFPPAPTTNIDLKRRNQWKLPCTPDLLLIPSKLTPFARTVLDNSTLVINPGQLTRDRSGGTFAVLDVHPIARDTLENAGANDIVRKHCVQDRTRIEIKRI